MSKKIWRGRSWKGAPYIHEVWRTEIKDDEDHTVVPDSACFPVKEARAYINAIEDGWKAQETNDPATDWDAESLKVLNARNAYLSAAGRMKKKAAAREAGK